MEWQTTCHPCPGNPRTKEPRKRRGPTPGRSSNFRSFRDLPFANLRLCRRLGCLPLLPLVFFPLVLSWCLLCVRVFTFVNSACYLARYMPEDIPNLVKSEQVGCAGIAKHPAAVG